MSMAVGLLPTLVLIGAGGPAGVLPTLIFGLHSAASVLLAG